MQKIWLDLRKTEELIEITEPTEIYGLFIGSGEESRQQELRVVHRKPNLSSLVTVKAVLLDKSQFDFTGTLQIETGAKGTDTYLRADVLMLSDNAHARAVPALEIEETDVKGGHGATVGKLDQDLLFYLTSRGLSRREATTLMVEGFLAGLASKAELTKLKSKLKGIKS